MEPLLVLRVPFEENLQPPGMGMERMMSATEEREGCCAGSWSSKNPNKQRGTWKQTEGQRTEVDIQLQLPRLWSPLLPERPYLGGEKREPGKGSGWELPGLRGKLGLCLGERRERKGSSGVHLEGVL